MTSSHPTSCIPGVNTEALFLSGGAGRIRTVLSALPVPPGCRSLFVLAYGIAIRMAVTIPPYACQAQPASVAVTTAKNTSTASQSHTVVRSVRV